MEDKTKKKKQKPQNLLFVLFRYFIEQNFSASTETRTSLEKIDQSFRSRFPEVEFKQQTLGNYLNEAVIHDKFGYLLAYKLSPTALNSVPQSATETPQKPSFSEPKITSPPFKFGGKRKLTEKEEEEKQILLEELKSFSPQSKSPLKFVENNKHVDSGMKPLLDLLERQVGSLEIFLKLWISSNYKKSLQSFIELHFVEREVEVVEKTESNLLKEIQNHFAASSTQILSGIDISTRGYKSLRDYMRKNTQTQARILVGQGKSPIPQLLTYEKAKVQANFSFAYENPTDFAQKVLNGNKMKVETVYLQFVGDQIANFSKSQERERQAEYRDIKTRVLGEEGVEALKSLHRPTIVPYKDPLLILLKRILTWYLQGLTKFDELEGDLPFLLNMSKDGTKRTGLGQTLPAHIQILFNAKYFQKEFSCAVEKPVPFVVGNLSENAANSRLLEVIGGKAFAKILPFQFSFTNKNQKVVNICFEYHASPGDLSQQSKACNNECVGSNHPCPKCEMCLHDTKIDSDFSFRAAMSAVRKTQENLELIEKQKEHMTMEAISSSKFALAPVTKNQASIVKELLEQLVSSQQKTLDGFKVAFYGQLQLKRDILTKTATSLGATVVNCTKADFIFMSDKSFLKYDKAYVIGDDQHVASLRLFFLLCHSGEDPPNIEAFLFTTKNTTVESVKLKKWICKCEPDSTVNGMKGVSPFIKSLEESLPLFCSDPLIASFILHKTKKAYKQRIDPLHMMKGMLYHVENALFGKLSPEKKEGENKKKKKKTEPQIAYVSEEKLLALSRNYFSHISFQQFFGSEHKELWFGAKVFIIPLLQGPEDKKQGFCLLVPLLQELCFLSNTKNNALQQCKLVQQRVWVRTFQIPYFLLKAFGQHMRRLIWCMYYHDLHAHTAELFEEILPSMEWFEGVLSKEVKAKTNNNSLDTLTAWLDRADKVEPQPNTKTKKNTFMKEFISNYEWSELSVDYDGDEIEVQYLLELLKKKGCLKDEHWFEVREVGTNKLLSIRFKNSPLLVPPLSSTSDL